MNEPDGYLIQFFNQTTSEPDRHILQQPIFFLFSSQSKCTIMQRGSSTSSVTFKKLNSTDKRRFKSYSSLLKMFQSSRICPTAFSRICGAGKHT